MKFNKFLFGAAALSMGVFASCSSDEPVKGPDGGNINKNGSNYIAVRINTTGVSRAEGDVYEVGEASESKFTAATTRFYFFDANGNAFNMTVPENVNGITSVSNMVTPTNVIPGNTDGNTTAGSAVLILGKAENESYQGVVPAKAVCVVNLSDDEFKALEGKSLSALADVANAITTTSFDEGKFVMSSSNYDGANTLGATDIVNKVAATIDAAEKDPADFWIERLAVKVRVTKGIGSSFVSMDEEDNTKAHSYTIFDNKVADGKYTTELSIKLNDWKLLKKADQAYLFKSLPTGEINWNWNDAEYHRSYWATTIAAAKYQANSDEFDIIKGEDWVTTPQYTYEWTKGNANAQKDRTGTTTAVVVRGYVQVQPEGATEASNINLVKWSGNYYEFDTFKQMVSEAYTADTGNDVTTFEVLRNDDNTCSSVINGVKYNRYDNYYYWQGGATSFYLNIQHATDNDGNAVYGVVRNHVYDYSLDKVVGLGVPGNNDVEIEDTKTFVAARLNVLKWKVVSNTVTLE